MPRDIPVGNGQLLVCFDSNYQIRDLYYPHVGQENHLIGYPCRMGVWVDGHFAWVSSPSWQKELRYQADTLISDVRLHHHEWGLRITCRDFVHTQDNFLLRRFEIENLSEHPRQVRLFLHHDFRIYGTEVGDTGLYHPASRSVVHYKGRRYFLCSFAGGIDHYSIGAKAMGVAEGTWKDAEDGQLANTPITHGSVDSTIGAYLALDAGQKQEVDYWLCVGQDLQEVLALNKHLSSNDLSAIEAEVASYWQLWVNKEKLDLGVLPEWAGHLFKRSLLLVQSQISHNGAITAANDSDTQATYKDHYSYLWPRDGALVAAALDSAGYGYMTEKFYALMSKLLGEDGYLLHKYNPAGTVASSWHPYLRGTQEHLPIQEDETALVIWGLWQHFRQHRNVEFCRKLYTSLVKPAAAFLLDYRDAQTGLPQPSYDLWEERYGVFTFTCCTVEAALRAAANFARAFGDTSGGNLYRTEASKVKAAIEKHLFDSTQNRYLRGLVYADDQATEAIPDSTVDASLFALYRFGTFSVQAPKVQATIQAIEEHLWIKTEIGGIARYQGDWYQHIHPPNTDVPGNPWIISTLWIMIAKIMAAHNEKELEASLPYLQWVCERSMLSGALSEQVHPYTGECLSVCPLTWSHATIIDATMLYLRKVRELKESSGVTKRIHLPGFGE